MPGESRRAILRLVHERRRDVAVVALAPSHAKKVQLFGEFVRNEVAEPVPHRHRVFSVPKMLRPYFKLDRALLKDLCRIARGCLVKWMREVPGWPEGVEAAVMATRPSGNSIPAGPGSGW